MTKNESKTKSVFPQNVKEYKQWINNQLAFIKQRSERIKNDYPQINVNFNFASNTPGFWKTFHSDPVTGYINFIPDPDTESPALAQCHAAIWSKQIPGTNGKVMELSVKEERRYRQASGERYQYYSLICNLDGKEIKFTSDIIVTDFSRYTGCRNVIQQLISADYPAEAKARTEQFYSSIGSFMIFPTIKDYGINPARGRNPLYDRFDLALDCIRCYYNGERSPLWKIFHPEEEFKDHQKLLAAIKKNQAFLNLFKAPDDTDGRQAFQRFVDFFYLQDLVTPDYSRVNFWL